MKHLLYHIYVIFLFASSFAKAQTFLYKYDQKNGLNTQNLRYTEIDQNGIVWMASQEGVIKFNGSSFTNFIKESKQIKKRSSFVDCRKLQFDSSSNTMLALGNNGSIDKISTMTSSILSTTNFTPKYKDEWATSFLQLNGEIWLCTTNGLYIKKNNENDYTSINLGFEKEAFFGKKKAIINSKNYILVSIDKYGIVIIDSKTKKLVGKISTVNFTNENIEIYDLLVYNNKLFVATSKGLFVFEFDVFKLPEAKQVKYFFKKDTQVSALAAHNNGVYIGCSTGFFNIDFNDNLQELKLEKENSNFPSVKEICHIKIHQNIIYLSTELGLIVLNKNQSFISNLKDATAENKLSHVFGIFASKNKDVFYATQKGLIKYDYQTKLLKWIYQKSAVYFVKQLEDNNLFFSTKNGCKIFDGSKIFDVFKVYKEFEQFKNIEINSIESYNNIYYLGTENEKGILIWNKTLHKLENINAFNRKDLLLSNTVNTIKLFENELFVLGDYTISSINLLNNKIKHIALLDTIKNEKIGLFFDIEKVGNTYWVSTYGRGLLLFNIQLQLKSTLSQSNHYLSNNGVYKIFAAKSKVFVSSNKGISIIDSNLNIKPRFLFASEGLHDEAFEEASGYKIDSLIYFGGINGATIINPSLFKINSAKIKLFFQDIIIETPRGKIDTINTIINNIKIPNTYTQIKINFIGINFENPYRVTYWYKINELHNSWIALENQNFISLIGIAPGKYTLQIKCANEDGIESDIKELQLHFLPKWYQTILFKIVVLLAIASLLFALYKYRINQLTKLLTMRQKISQDLHDDVGSSLSSIKMYSQVVQLQQNTNNQLLQNIETNTSYVLEKLDDIVWATNPKNDNLQNVIDRLELFAKPLCKAANINLQFIVPLKNDNIFVVDIVRQALYLIVKEAINNAVKYANCSNLNFTLELNNNKLLASIIDDGIGFDTAIATTRNGLINMQQRANQAKGKLSIYSIINKGTTIKLALPLKKQ